MKTIGLIGGMSWESTAHYYAHLNRLVRARLGGHHSAPLILHSFDFAEIEHLQRQGAWDELGRRLAAAAKRLEGAGAEAILICANTMHLVAGDVAKAVGVPLIHIIDATAEAVEKAGFTKAGLLGTAYTMEKPFWRDRMRSFGIEAVVPEAEDRALCHRIIFEELVHGIVLTESRLVFRRMIEGLVSRGCQGIILGCTELAMIVCEEDSPVPLFDTAEIHAQAAVAFALDGA